MEKIGIIAAVLCLLFLIPAAAGEHRKEPIAFTGIDNTGFLLEGQVVDEETGEGIENAEVVVSIAGKSWKIQTETKIISQGYWGEWEQLGYSAKPTDESEYKQWPVGWVQHSENSASHYGKCIVVDGGKKTYWVSEISYGRRWVDNSKRDGGYFRTFVGRRD